MLNLAKNSGVEVIHGPSERVNERPLVLLQALFMGAMIELASVRGFYFTYGNDGVAVGAVDLFAVRRGNEKKTWMLACAIHEPKR